MAIAKVSKVLVACHNSERDDLIRETQRAGILHISNVSEESPELERSLSDLLNSIEEAIRYLEGLEPKEKKGGIFRERLEVAEEDFRKAEDGEGLKSLQKIRDLRQEKENLEEREKEIDNQLTLLEPFVDLPYKLEDLVSITRFEVILGFFPKEEISPALAEAAEKGIFLQEIKREPRKVFCLMLYPKEHTHYFKEFLRKRRFQVFDLRGFKGTVRENIRSLKREREELKRRREAIAAEILKLHKELPLLKVSADCYKNLQIRRKVARALLSTESAVLIEGWVKERDFGRLRKVVERFPTAILTKIPPKSEEEPPVALENRRPFQPFEFVVSLYGMPHYSEIDPTPFLAPFFVIFFGLCLTDAGYGIVLFLLSLFLIRRFPKGKNFFILVAICGLFTIFAGAATNSWFGDIFDRLGLSYLISFKERLIIFDPFKNPLLFFFVSLALGYIHLNYGLLIEIYDSFRIKNPLPALFNEFSWFCALNSLLFYVLFGKSFPLLKPLSVILLLLAAAAIITLSRFSFDLLPRQLLFFSFFASSFLFFGYRLKLLPSFFNNFQFLALFLFLILILLALWDSYRSLHSRTGERIKRLGFVRTFFYSLVLLSFLAFIRSRFFLFPFLLLGFISLFLSPLNRKVLKKLLWGAYNLYGGTSFLGIVLSYIRLMALGMVTGGIAMAINTIAWMTVRIPGLGIILTILILIIGHTYNIAVNVLGAFVHTLRLNYVEFFPRFFKGGGERFSPFKLETKYVEVN